MLNFAFPVLQLFDLDSHHIAQNREIGPQTAQVGLAGARAVDFAGRRVGGDHRSFAPRPARLPIHPPKLERVKMKALDPAETARLAHFRGARMFTPVLLAASRG